MKEKSRVGALNPEPATGPKSNLDNKGVPLLLYRGLERNLNPKRTPLNPKLKEKGNEGPNSGS